MPKEWTDLLMKSNISKQEQANNPQAVLDVLQYYDTNTKQSSKFMTATHTNNGNTFNLILFQNINVLFCEKNSSTKQ